VKAKAFHVSKHHTVRCLRVMDVTHFKVQDWLKVPEVYLWWRKNPQFP
jgi:hypothetical protein